MKKITYYITFIFLGILLQFLIHGLLEVWYINLLTKDFNKYSLGFSWNYWVTAHHVGTVILLLTGILFGYWQGKYWWPRIYERKKYT